MSEAAAVKSGSSCRVREGEGEEQARGELLLVLHQLRLLTPSLFLSLASRECDSVSETPQSLVSSTPVVGDRSRCRRRSSRRTPRTYTYVHSHTHTRISLSLSLSRRRCCCCSDGSVNPNDGFWCSKGRPNPREEYACFVLSSALPPSSATDVSPSSLFLSFPPPPLACRGSRCSTHPPPLDSHCR